MILRRYLNKEVLATSLVVMLFLLMMTMGSWLIRYFGMAAKGNLAFGIVFELMFYQIPLLLELILPLSFFIGLMLSFGRQYVEHEMTIVKTAGMSPRRFAQLLVPLITAMFVTECFITLYAKPAGMFAAEKLKAEQAVKSTFDLVKPKEFVSFNQYSLYVGSFSADKTALQDIMLIERGGASDGRDRIILAKKAVQVKMPANASELFQTSALTDEASDANDAKTNNDDAKDNEHVITQLDLYQGRQYELAPNQQKYNQIGFERYRVTVKLPNKKNKKQLRIEARNTWTLFKELPDKKAIAELGFRFTLPFAILLAVVLALPLSYVRPRQGRWLRLMPAILLFATSVLIMNSLKGSVSKGKMTVLVLPAVFLLYGLFAVYLYNKNKVHSRIKSRFKRISNTDKLNSGGTH